MGNGEGTLSSSDKKNELSGLWLIKWLHTVKEEGFHLANIKGLAWRFGSDTVKQHLSLCWFNISANWWSCEMSQHKSWWLLKLLALDTRDAKNSKVYTVGKNYAKTTRLSLYWPTTMLSLTQRVHPGMNFPSLLTISDFSEKHETKNFLGWREENLHLENR